MIVSFDIKFIRRNQKQRRNGEAYVVFYISCIISRFNGENTAKQVKSRCSFVQNC